jgi:hypothetical protein
MEPDYSIARHVAKVADDVPVKWDDESLVRMAAVLSKH